MKNQKPNLIDDWAFYDACHCSGVHMTRYRSPSFRELEIEVIAGKFRITYLRTSTKVGRTWLAKLPETLNKIKEEYAQASQ
jgi:hypothetical protein